MNIKRKENFRTTTRLQAVHCGEVFQFIGHSTLQESDLFMRVSSRLPNAPQSKGMTKTIVPKGFVVFVDLENGALRQDSQDTAVVLVGDVTLLANVPEPLQEEEGEDDD